MSVAMVGEMAHTPSIRDPDMHCRRVADILDEGAERNVSAAQCWEVHVHLTLCPNCANAWLAHQHLVRLRVPPLPASLFEGFGTPGGATREAT